MTTINSPAAEDPEFIELSLTADQAKWFIEQLQKDLQKERQHNEMLRNQIDRIKEVRL